MASLNHGSSKYLSSIDDDVNAKNWVKRVLFNNLIIQNYLTHIPLHFQGHEPNTNESES